MADGAEKKEHEEMDPATSAVVLAGKGAAEVVTPKLREALLGPLARAYGEHWGTEAEERLRIRREEKRAQNAFTHISAVAAMKPSDRLEGLADEPTFDDWLRGASEVDPDIDPDLADFWRAALVALAEGDVTRLRLLRIVRSLETDDAAFLASGKMINNRLFKPLSDLSSDKAKRLELAGVIKYRLVMNRRTAPLVGIVVLGPLLLWTSIQYVVKRLPLEIVVDGDLVILFSYPISAMVFFLMVIFSLSVIFPSTRQLTDEGVHLFELLERVRSAPQHSSQHSTNTPTSTSPEAL